MKAFAKKNTTTPKAAANKAAESPFFTVQAKLQVGKENDPYEVQADSMAEQVVHHKKEQANQAENSSFFSPKPSLAKSISPGVQLQPMDDVMTMVVPEGDLGVQRMPFEEVQTKCDNCESEEQTQAKVQRMPFEEMPQGLTQEAQFKRSIPNGPMPDIAGQIQNKKGTGSPLPDPVKQDMESGFGADFSGVNVHNDSESAQMSKDLGAKAFTSGNDIFFNQGQFSPETTEGQTLLAHELTHTIQQGASPALEESTDTADAHSSGNDSSNQANTASEGQTDAEPETGELPEGENPADEVQGEAGANAENGQAAGEEQATTTPRSPEEDPNFQQLETRVEDTATEQQDHIEPAAASGAAQGAAVSPPNERASLAEAGQVDAMDNAEAGEFSAEDFKEQLMQRIESMQLPANEEEADDFEDNNNIQEVTDAATGDVQAEQSGAAGAIESTTTQEPNAEAVPEREVTPLEEPPIGETPASVNPDRAMPPPRGRAEVNQPLEENMSEVDQAQEEAQVTDEMLANSNEPSFTGALENKEQAKEHTQNAPNELRQQEQNVLQNAQINANSASQEGLTAMHNDRTNALNTVAEDQQTTGDTDTAERTRIADEINQIFENTKTDVEAILADLDAQTTEMFQAGATIAKQRFENYVERKMDDYKDERYSGVGGALTWVGDAFTGLPDEVNEFFVDGRQVFIDYMDGVITRIAQYVADKLNEAKTRITEGKQEVQDYVTSLPENLQQIGSEAAEEIASQFDELEESVNSKQEELIDSLADQYSASLEEVDARIEEMQAANRGLIDMALGAIMGVIQTIIDIKNMLTELLVGAANAIMTIISDPIGFLSNLFGGIKQGFEQFGSNILTHLQTALIQWLTGALGPVGITMPDDLFSLQGIFSLVAQILGLTWDYIRQKAVRHLGEPVVVALETGFEIFQVIRTGGIDGLWEYLKEQFNDLKETVIDSIKEMVITTVIEAGIKWVLGLLNPASAFVKACMMIIDVVRFFIERGSQIIELVRAFIEGVNAVASGNVTAVANAIENALARALPVIIGFLASLLGISGLARKVTKLIGKIRKRVDKAVEKLIKKAKAAGRRLLARMGVGRNPDGSAQPDQAGGDGELGKTVQFNDGEENHRLWVDETGAIPVLKVASTPKTVEDKIEEWEALLATREWQHGGRANKKQRIIGLINNVKSKLATIKNNITTAERSEAQGESVPDQVDNSIEQNETTMAQSLKSIFSEFGEDQDFKVVYAEELMQSHTAAKPIVDASVDILSEAANRGEIQSWSGIQRWLKVTEQTDTLFNDPINNPTPYGTAVKQQIDQAGEAELGAETWNEKKDELIAKLTPGTHAHNGLKNQILDKNQEAGTTQAIKSKFQSDAEHSDYKPQSTVPSIDNGTFKLAFDYNDEAETQGRKRDFVVRFSLRSAEDRTVDQSTTGSNLTLKRAGTRGRTDSAGELTEAGYSDNINSAHVLADWFEGSGYKGSLNLIAASEHYNKQIMAAAEASMASQIGAWTSNYGNNPPVTITTQVHVQATWQAMANDKVVEAMKAVEASKGKTAEELNDLARLTYAALQQKQLPRKCLRVTYQARMMVNGVPTSMRFSEQIGPDNWLTY